MRVREAIQDMLKLFKRSSKPVNYTESEERNQSSSIISPINRREILTRFVGKGREGEPLNEIFEKSNISKYCRVTIQDCWLVVSELTDVELVRISGDQIKRCVQDKPRNCVAVIHDTSTYLFETCSVKEVRSIAPPISIVLSTLRVRFDHWGHCTYS